MRPDTLLVHAGEPHPRIEGAVAMPIFQSATFQTTGDSGYHDIRDARLSNTPNHTALHAKIAALEGSETALVAASGMAAISTALLSVLKSGDHLLAHKTLYGGTHEGAARFARSHDLVSFIDNTFASPLGFRPIAVGFDLVLHSATKYLNGHSDLIAGAIAGSARRIEAVKHTLDHLGGSLDPHACFLLHRGLKTLGVRFRHQTASALRIARFLAEHPAVARVNHPGLPSHPQHERARRLLPSGTGGMLSFEMRGGRDAAERLLSRVRVPINAPSLGGTESLITRPAATSHAGLTPEERRAAGIGDGLVRFSVGIEDPEDLIDDLRQALDGVAGSAGALPE